jgi:hypothetical protein
MDTGSEHPETYRFIRDVVKNTGINLICLRMVPLPMNKGVTYKVVSIDEIKCDLVPYRLMVEKYGIPYFGGAFCTDRMKLKPFKKYCDDTYGKNKKGKPLNYETWLGIRIDEQARIKKEPGIRYLAEISDMDKQDIADLWSERDWRLKRPEHLGNCVFCIKKSLKKVWMAAKDEPELANQFTDMLYGAMTGRASEMIMYRSKMKFTDVIQIFDDHDYADVSNATKRAGSEDSGSCSESCEVFTCSI